MRKTLCKFFTSAFLLAFVLACAPAVPADRFTMTTSTLPEKTDTPAGVLEIAKDKNAEGTFNILLSGKRIDQTEGFTAYIHGVYPNLKEARLVLLGVASGGTGCQLMYKLIEIKDNGSATVTDEFGNCNAINDITFKNGAWHFRLPGPGNLPAEMWVYRNGKITKLNHPS